MISIDIKGLIVRNDDKWIYDWLEYEASCPKDVITKLRESNMDDVEININSGGGNVHAGMEIYTALKEHKGRVTCKIVGLAASAASVIAMAAEKIKISPVSQIMIHKASVSASGNHNAMDHISEILQSYDQGIANAYMLKTGMDKKAILELMDKETYFSAQKALELGFVDEIMFDEDLQLSASVQGDIPPDIINKIKNQLLKNEFKSSDKDAFLVAKIENGVENPQPTSNITLKEQQEEFRKLKSKIMGGIQ
jgi:ATP-dependent Clp protease protease subunit